MILAIDGIPGTGKTSLAMSVAESLTARGHSVKLWLETDASHPLHPIPTDEYGAAWPEMHLRISAERFVDQTLERWCGLIAENRGEVVIVESFPFQSTLRVLLQMNAPSSLIDIYWVRWLAVADGAVKIVYLRVSDPVEQFERICQLRGSEWRDYICNSLAETPFAQAQGLSVSDVVPSLVERFSQSMDELVSGSTVPVLTLSGVSTDYDDRLAHVLAWIENI